MLWSCNAADSIEKKSGQPLPPFINKKDKIVLTLKVVDVFDNEDAVQKDRETALWKPSMQKKPKKWKIIWQRTSIQAQKTAKGTFVKIENPGDGPAVDSGKQVSVIYTGKLFPSGKDI